MCCSRHFSRVHGQIGLVVLLDSGEHDSTLDCLPSSKVNLSLFKQQRIFLTSANLLRCAQLGCLVIGASLAGTDR